MLKALVAWIKTEVAHLKAVRARKRYDRGYREAMSIMCDGTCAPEYLYRKTESAQVLGEFNEYHNGVRAAIYDFELSGVDEAPVHAGA